LSHPDLDIKIFISLQREPAPAWREISLPKFVVIFVASLHHKVRLWAHKCFITMVIVSPIPGVVFPDPFQVVSYSWLVNGGDPNHLLTGMIIDRHRWRPPDVILEEKLGKNPMKIWFDVGIQLDFRDSHRILSVGC